MAETASRSQRLFLALDLPTEVKDRLSRVRPRSGPLAHGLRWVLSEGMHLTLQFLGDVSFERLPALREALITVPLARPASIQCIGLQTLGSQRRPRVLAAGISGDVDGVRSVHAAVGAACQRSGLQIDHRSFQPHVTLARARREGAEDVAAALRALTSEHSHTFFGSFAPVEMVLFRSFLGPGGSRYEPQIHLPLGE